MKELVDIESKKAILNIEIQVLKRVVNRNEKAVNELIAHNKDLVTQVKQKWDELQVLAELRDELQLPFIDDAVSFKEVKP